jgi:hypothetical protein
VFKFTGINPKGKMPGVHVWLSGRFQVRHS